MKNAPVFLSASLPDPKRHRRYYDTADLVAIRDAVHGLASVVLEHSRLVFGGHPAITPLVRRVAQRLGQETRVTVYQSRFFESLFPRDLTAFTGVVLVDEVPSDRQGSLLAMRQEMLDSARFRAGVFIGGMEGVEEEFDLFIAKHPTALALPVASTGAAAKILLNRHTRRWDAARRKALETYGPFVPLFRSLLGYTGARIPSKG